jgi:hypothetical protein
MTKVNYLYLKPSLNTYPKPSLNTYLKPSLDPYLKPSLDPYLKLSLDLNLLSVEEVDHASTLLKLIP